MMNEVEIKNNQLTLASIRSDTLSAAEELSKLLKEKERVQASIVEDKAEHAEAKKELDRAYLELEDERARLKMERKVHEDWVARSKKELDVLNQQKKEAMAELKRLNEWIFAGETRKRELDGEIADLKEQLKEKRLLEQQILDLIDEKRLAEEERNVVRLDTRLMVDEAETALIKIREQLSDAEISLDQAKKDRAEEEVRLNDYRNQRVQLKIDTDVVVARIEEKYGEAFPDLKLKL